MALGVRCVILGCFAGACSADMLAPVARNITVDPARLDVGPLPLGFVRESRIDVVNTGARPEAGRIRIADPSGVVVDAEPADWRVAPGARARITVRLTADRVGEVSAELELVPSDEALDVVVARLTGLGVARPFDVEPASLGFGDVRLDTRQSRTLRVVNRQAEPLPFTVGLESREPFGIGGSEERWLGPGATGEITVDFRPDRIGDARTTLRVDGQCRGPCAAQVPVAGTGVASGLRCPARLDFGVMNPGGCARVVMNCPSIFLRDPIDVLDWQVESTFGTFSAEPPRPVTVEPGSAFSLPLRFCPTRLGPDEAAVALTVRERRTGTDVVRVPLAGAGGGPDLRTRPALLSFGGAVVGDSTERTIVVDNDGYAPLTVGATDTTGPFRLDSEAPVRLEPAEARTLRLRFTPEVDGLVDGLLRIESDDPDAPTTSVPLSGYGVLDRPCAAELTPASLTFGLVTQGDRSENTATLRAAGPEACEWFEPRIEGSAAFALAPGTPIAGTVTASRAKTFRVAFAPTRSSPLGADTAQLAIDLPNTPAGTLRVPLWGVSTSAELLAHPRSITFGPIGLDRPRRRTIRLYNLGTRVQRVTDVALAPGTSPDFSVEATGLVPVTLAAGAHVEAVVTYTPSAAGRDGGRVRFAIDGVLAPVEVPLLGEAEDRACGHVTGAVCTPDGRFPSVGADVVLVTARGQTFSTTTDEDGTFDLFCLPSGPATLRLRKGHFTESKAIDVATGRTTDAGHTCLDPTSPQVAVVTGTHDRVQVLLQQLGMQFDEFAGISALPNVLDDRSLLLSYDIVLLNCGFDDSAVRRGDIADNLRAFVDRGGSLYVSDFGYDAVEGAFSTILDFAGADGVQDAAEVGATTLLRARVVDPELLRWMPPRRRFDVNLVTGYAVIDAYGPATKVHVLSDAGGVSRPLVVSADRTGRLVYTAYHYTAGQVDPAALEPLKFAIFGM